MSELGKGRGRNQWVFFPPNNSAIKFHKSYLCFFNLSFHLRSVGSFWSLTLETSFRSDTSFHTWIKTTGFHITALGKSTWRKEHDRKTDKEVTARGGTQRCVHVAEAWTREPSVACQNASNTEEVKMGTVWTLETKLSPWHSSPFCSNPPLCKVSNS